MRTHRIFHFFLIIHNKKFLIYILHSGQVDPAHFIYSFRMYDVCELHDLCLTRAPRRTVLITVFLLLFPLRQDPVQTHSLIRAV